MFSAIAKLFKKSSDSPASPGRSAVSPKRWTHLAMSSSARTLPKVGTPPAPSAPKPSRPLAARAVANGNDSISIPYASIIRCVPQELWGKLAPAGAGAAEYVISRSHVLEQFPQGAVKVPLGELRRHGPAGLFANNSSQESRLIDLPLADILAQLHPDTFARRPNQNRVQVSEELPDLFGAKGQRLAPVRVMDKRETATAFAARQSRAPARTVAPVESTSLQQPPKPAASQRTVVPAPAAPIKPATPLPAQTPAALKPAAAPNPIPKAPATVQARPPAKPLPKATTPKPATPQAPPQPISNHFLVPVAVVAESWPEEIRKELACMKLPGANLAIPAVEICEGLKRRMVQFPWRVLRGWLQPQPTVEVPSSHETVVIELPLNTITPLFLEYLRANPANLKVADSETITEFFRRADQSSQLAPELVAPVEPTISSLPLTAARQSIAPARAASVPAEGIVEIPLASVQGFWPDAVKRDIAQFNIAQAVVCIPAEHIDVGLKAGKVEFTWREVCGWLKPASPAAQHSINGEVRLPFPLQIVAPLFMQRNAGAHARRKTRVDEEIPDLFSAGGLMPQAGAPAAPVNPAPVAAPSVVPLPATQSAAPAPSAALKPGAKSLAELFNEPDKRSWTPNDIVHRAAQLPGVAGSLIALQDGLLVAACMPPEARTETIAAFVPQIFGRMSQYTRELQLGDARGVSITVDSGTLQVFSAGIIFFAALSKPGGQLPLPELQLIASELGRHTK